MLGASVSHFIPDAKSMFRNTGQPAVTEYTSPPLEMARLQSQWRANEFGRRVELPVWVNVLTPALLVGPAYFFALELDVTPAFTLPSMAAVYDYNYAAVNPFELVLTEEKMMDTCAHATHIRLTFKSSPGSPAIQFCALPRGDVPRM